MSFSFRFLPWDTKFFGFRIARLEVDAITQDEIEEISIRCKTERIRCLYCLTIAQDQCTTGLLEQHGYQYADVRLTLGSRGRLRNGTVPTGVEIRLAKPSDLVALRSLAAASHTDSRFFFDLRFPRERSAALYEIWIERDVTGLGRKTLVAIHAGRVAGYLSVDVGGQTGASVSLLAVAPDFRGRGIGRCLVESALELVNEMRGDQPVSVVTQGRNVEAQRLYQGSGFRTIESAVWFHRWFDDC